MANKKYDEVRNLSDEELKQDLTDSKTKLKRLSFGHAVSPLENPNVLGEVRKHIARLKTEQRKRELSNKA